MSTYHVCLHPIVQMRESPSYSSKVVSQTFFSEQVVLSSHQGEWSYVTTSDKYSGWALSSSFIHRTTPYKGEIRISRLTAHIYDQPDIEFGPKMTLPFDVHLQISVDIDNRWIEVILPDNTKAYVQKGDVTDLSSLYTKKNLASFSLQFLNIPYTWGGRSSFGFDCSGFIQMLYRQIGIALPRDAYLQILECSPMDTIELGDLIFFGQSSTHIQHVGMYLGEGQFIHASAKENQPWIRISQLDEGPWTTLPGSCYPYRIICSHRSHQ